MTIPDRASEDISVTLKLGYHEGMSLIQRCDFVIGEPPRSQMKFL